ncbi:oxygenase MpaB family protein [Sorangium sp. So ce134]
MSNLDQEAQAQIQEDAAIFASGVAWVKARAAGEVEGIFGPESAMWQVLREPAVALGGVRAVLVQIAHPAIAAAGVQNSNIQREFLARAPRTFSSMYEIMFGDLSTALRYARAVHVRHARIRGIAAAGAGPRWEGRPYRGNDPELLRWVLWTLIDSPLNAFEAFLSPMPEPLAEWFYHDMTVLGVLLGVPREIQQATLRDSSESSPPCSAMTRCRWSRWRRSS